MKRGANTSLQSVAGSSGIVLVKRDEKIFEKINISPTLTQEELFEALDDLEVFGNYVELQKRLDEMSPQTKKTYFATRYPQTTLKDAAKPKK